MTDPIGFQVTVDCADPHAQARFWAGVLRWDVESNDELVRRVLAAGQAGDDDVVEIDGTLFWRTLTAIRLPGGEGALVHRVLFQLVPQPTPGKNRWHLDVNVGRDRRDAEVERIVALGATEVERFDDQPGGHWVLLADPEGNRFCVQ